MEPAPRPWLSIVIPVWNEAARLGPTIERIGAFLARQPYASELVVADDGSTDGTSAVAEAAAARVPGLKVVRAERNRGKGHAVRMGVLAARGERVLFTDADLSTPIEEASRLLEALSPACGMAVGSRRLAGPRLPLRRTLLRRIAGTAWALSARLLHGLGVRDTQCGFKAWTAEAAAAIFSRQRLDGFAFDLECLLIARDLGIGVREVPVPWTDAPGSHIRLMRDALAMLSDSVRLLRRAERAGRAPGDRREGVEPA